jgi:hypothetical protein
MKTNEGGAAGGSVAKMMRRTGLLVLILAALVGTGCVGYYEHPYAGGYYATGYPYGYGYPYAGYPYGGPYGYGGAGVVISSGGYRGYGNRYYGRHYYRDTSRVRDPHQATRNGGTSSRPHANGGTRTKTTNPRTQSTLPE